jgi:hypothetical protein
VTNPKISTIKRGGSRLYVHPETAAKQPGVTSVLGMLPKGFLKFWAAKSVAEYAVDNLGAVVTLAFKDPSAAVDLLKRAPDRDTRQAADKGTEVHDLFERLARGDDVGRIPPDLEPYVALFKGFVAQYEPEFLFLEGTVWSETYGFAGSFDFIAVVTDPDTGERMTVIGDWKTTRSGVHEEVALQLTAYAHADYIINPDGSTNPIPKLDGGIVVHVRPEGGQVVPARIDDALMPYFEALRKVFDWDREVNKTVLGQPMPIEPVVEATGRRGGRR